MIEKLNNKDPEIAAKIRSVFQVSYPFEAELIQAIEFPPLNRVLSAFINTETEFYGYWKKTELAAVVEIKYHEDATHIQSLVVDPKFFRQGIAKQLINFVFHTFDSEIFTVETGLANQPAVTLYEQIGFKEIKQYDTSYGIRKIRFELKRNS